MNPLGAALVLAIPPTKSRADDHSKGGSKRTPAAKLEIMTHFKEGDEIVLKEDAGHTLVQDLKAALDSLVVHAGGVDPHHRTVWQIHGGTVRPKTEIYETDL
jgi:hypothetical protein